MKKKKLLPLFFTLCMVFSLTPMTALADSQEPVNYVERSWDGTQVVETTRTCTDYELLHSTNSSWYTIGQEGQTTWYIASGNITMNGTTLTVRGNVNIILCDGANVKIKDGIEVKTDYSLTIYGQSGDSGKLYAVNNSGDAGIGCGPNSGVGHITIHGGVIEAHGGKYAAGIGSGDERQMGSHITIYGGDIKAYGGDYGAGIGSGDETSGDNGYIDIYGGKIYAKGGTDGAGIGGGNEGNGRHITIWGGEIEAVAGGGTYSEAAGIGGAIGENLVKGSITINGGKVTASSRKTALIEELHTAEHGSAGIGSGGCDITGGADLKIPITINGGNVRATGSAGSAGIGTGLGGDVYGQITINGGNVDAYANSDKASGAGIGSGDAGDVKTKIIISGENGGTVIAQASDVDGAQAIGTGDSNFSSAGVELYDEAKVTAGSSSANVELQTSDNRLSGLKKKYAKIELCEHSSKTYTQQSNPKDGHVWSCQYCETSGNEAHNWSDGKCTKCGYTNEQTQDSPKPLTLDMVSFKQNIYIYDGEVKTPELIVKDGDRILELNNDYVISDTSVTSASEVGAYRITVVGRGDYTGTIEDFWIISTGEPQGGDDDDEEGCSRDDTCPITPFTDTNKNEWYHDGVHWALEEGVMNGTSENAFEPLTTTTRAMIVTMLWRMEGKPLVDGSITFKDVPDGQWYTDAIKWAVSNGIVTGYDEDTFGTNDSVTREQLATILYRSAQAKGKGFTGTWAFPLSFDDADQVSEWADEAMHWMIMNGVIQGMSDTELSPQGDAVRAQVATMLMRFDTQIQDQDLDVYLTLVNKTNKLPDNWLEKIELVTAQNSLGREFQVESVALEHFEQLREQMLSEGIDIELDSTYRSVQRQEELWAEFEEKYGLEYCQKYVAVPGYSEHHTGLAIDVCLIKDGEVIDDNDAMIAETEIFAKVHEKLADYGFILRYPEGREDVTGYSYEPWHFRYVGEEAAKEITEQGITLEEYLA